MRIITILGLTEIICCKKKERNELVPSVREATGPRVEDKHSSMSRTALNSCTIEKDLIIEVIGATTENLT